MERTGIKKIILGVITAIVILSLAFLIFHKYSSKKYMSISTFPSDATVELNGKVVSGESKIELKQTKNRIKVSRKGFDSVNKEVSATKRQNDVSIILHISKAFLSSGQNLNLPQKDIQAIKQPAEEIDKTTGIPAVIADSIIQQKIADSDLLSKLPYFGDGFRVGYGESKKDPRFDNLAIYIAADSPQSKQKALDWLKANGGDPSTLEIIYIEY